MQLIEVQPLQSSYFVYIWWSIILLNRLNFESGIKSCVRACVCVHLQVSYPEGAAGHIDLSPGDDDGVFNGLDRSVYTVKCAISPVSDLDVYGGAFSILSGYKILSGLDCTPHMNISDPLLWMQNKDSRPYLCIDLELTLPSHAGVNSEFGRFVHNDASRLQAWTISFHLEIHYLGCSWRSRRCDLYFLSL